MIDLIKGWRASGRLVDRREEELWMNGAYQFRLPYWDWARKQSYDGNFAIPEVCILEKLEIILVGGKTDPNFPNPLVGFTNPRGVAMGDSSMGVNAIKDDVDEQDPSNTLPVSDSVHPNVCFG